MGLLTEVGVLTEAGVLTEMGVLTEEWVLTEEGASTVEWLSTEEGVSTKEGVSTEEGVLEVRVSTLIGVLRVCTESSVWIILSPSARLILVSLSFSWSPGILIKPFSKESFSAPWIRKNSIYVGGNKTIKPFYLNLHFSLFVSSFLGMGSWKTNHCIFFCLVMILSTLLIELQ